MFLCVEGVSLGRRMIKYIFFSAVLFFVVYRGSLFIFMNRRVRLGRLWRTKITGRLLKCAGRQFNQYRFFCLITWRRTQTGQDDYEKVSRRVSSQIRMIMKTIRQMKLNLDEGESAGEVRMKVTVLKEIYRIRVSSEEGGQSWWDYGN